MGFFDFFKKNELEEINSLKNENLKLKNDLFQSNVKVLDLKHELQRYSPIKEIEKEAKAQNENLNNLIAEKSRYIQKQSEQLSELNSKYQEALDTYDKLRSEINIYENKLNLIDYGLYEPIYDFDQSDKYRIEQEGIVINQKHLIQIGKAAVCNTTWTVNGSEAKGKVSINRYIKLVLRAFNGECDALVAKVRWNNINQLRERLKKSFEALNKLGESNDVHITDEYFDLKMKELVLEYEFKAKKQQEKEEMKALLEEAKEEEKVQRELEKAQRDAEKEEEHFQKALDKVKFEYLSKNENSEILKNKILELEKELEEARQRKERALSMAQQTKQGYVYVISNIGSFGEDVYKIGMTRRLEPLDRVRELGDASVPFRFDVHALIFSPQARTLESELHKAFSDKALNLLNNRKEFFRVSLEEIELKIKELGFQAEFIKEPEAKEFKESLILKVHKPKNEVDYSQESTHQFPKSIIF